MSNPNNPSDFVQVRLTTAGVTFAGESQTLRMGNAHSDYVFVGQTPQKVVRRGELAMFLGYHLADGSPAFELVPASPNLIDSTHTSEELAHAE